MEQRPIYKRSLKICKVQIDMQMWMITISFGTIY